MAAAARVLSPVAPLRQTFQDIVAEAELVVSLAAVDALQSDPHQLVRVPDDLLLALQHRGRRMSARPPVCPCISAPLTLLLHSARRCCVFLPPFVLMCVVCRFRVAAATCPWRRSGRGRKYNIYGSGTQQTGLDAAPERNLASVCACLRRAWSAGRRAAAG